MPGTPVSTRAPAPAFGPEIKFNTAPTRAAHGWPNPATWPTWATNNKTLSTIQAGITLHGLVTSGIAAVKSITATKPDGVRMHPAAGVAMHKAATLILFAAMLAGLLAAMLAYFDVLIA